MKPVILFALLTICAKSNFAQCGKSATLVSSKTEYLDGTYTLQRTVEEKSTIEINKAELVITPGDQPKMVGKITSDSCDWKRPFKEGKSVIKAIFTREGQAQQINATVTIEGKDGKVTLIMEMEQMPDKKIRITADKFEEKI